MSVTDDLLDYLDRLEDLPLPLLTPLPADPSRRAEALDVNLRAVVEYLARRRAVPRPEAFDEDQTQAGQSVSLFGAPWAGPEGGLFAPPELEDETELLDSPSPLRWFKAPDGFDEATGGWNTISGCLEQTARENGEDVEGAEAVNVYVLLDEDAQIRPVIPEDGVIGCLEDVAGELIAVVYPTKVYYAD